MQMSGNLGYREVLALTMESLTKRPRGQYGELVEDVLRAAERKGLISNSQAPHEASLSRGERDRLLENVQEAMWDCLLKRLIVFGSDRMNFDWPFYRVTEYGERALKNTPPQPYDPDGFMDYFDTVCAGVDPAVRDYVAESIQAFNAGCTRSAAVMLGCASEKMLLLLCDNFEAAIADTTKREKFTKEINAKWMVSHKYATLRDRLELMMAAKKLPRDHAETLGSELPAGFELLRRCRNAAGHPDVPGNIDPDTVFLNLRTFTEYARRVLMMIQHFGGSTADW